MGDTNVRAAVSHVLSVLREAGRAEGTVRRHQIVLDRFAVFLAGRGLDTASEGACIDFITDQTENVFPMIAAGKGLSEMILAEEL